MYGLLKEEILKNGAKFSMIPIECLEDLKKDIEEFRKREDLNGFQKFITGSLYNMELPRTDFTIRSIIIIATPVPAYAKVIINWKGRKVKLASLARCDIGKEIPAEATAHYLDSLLTPGGFHMEPANQLPLKRLAVRSGLALYGRNNVTFVEGMGSFLTLTAYYTDVPCPEDSWHEVRNMDSCRNCTACLKNCPTGAILKDRFLINNEICLSNLNESPGDFPDWLPKSVHHCIYDCFRCTYICPRNREFIDNSIGPIEFDEAETSMLLSGAFQEFSATMREKIKILGMDEWIASIPRNIKAVLENDKPEWTIRWASPEDTGEQ